MKINKKRINIFILLIMLTVTVISIKNVSYSFAAEIDNNYIKYSISNNEVLITGYSGHDEVLYLPNKIEGYSVTSIASYAFRECHSLKKIVIPDSVTDIGIYAFSNCSSLENIEIPNSVTYIGGAAFSNCTRLKSIEIPNSVTYIGGTAFSNCTSLKSIEIPNSVTSIGNYTFEKCISLESIKIPNSVTSIELCAFKGCTSLKSIEIPNSVTSIGNAAFSNCTRLKSIEIPNSVTSIGDYTFEKCTSLESIKIPNSVTSIREALFNRCTSLESIEIPDSVISIGRYAFSNCTRLKSIEIPNGVKSISDYTFYSCNNLESIEIPNGVKSISDYTFYYCDNLRSVKLPNGLISIGKSAFIFCTSLDSIKIPNSVASIGNYAFSENTILNVEWDSYARQYAQENNFKFSAIDGIDISILSLNKIPNQTYTGKTIKPKLTIKDGIKVLDEDIDYILSYSNNKEVGTATITIKGIGRYCGTKNVTFKIVPNDINLHWAENTIIDFIDKGYINGYSDGTFRPNNSITRAEFVKIVNNMFGYTSVGSVPFNDVISGAWYYNDVAIAVKAGYINGKNATTFAPNDPITRQEVAKILTTIMNNSDTNHDKLNTFKDGNNTADWAKSYVEGAIEAGYLNGDTEGNLNPTSNITRAEAVTMLSRVK